MPIVHMNYTYWWHFQRAQDIINNTNQYKIWGLTLFGTWLVFSRIFFENIWLLKASIFGLNSAWNLDQYFRLSILTCFSFLSINKINLMVLICNFFLNHASKEFLICHSDFSKKEKKKKKMQLLELNIYGMNFWKAVSKKKVYEQTLMFRSTYSKHFRFFSFLSFEVLWQT